MSQQELSSRVAALTALADRREQQPARPGRPGFRGGPGRGAEPVRVRDAACLPDVRRVRRRTQPTRRSRPRGDGDRGDDGGFRGGVRDVRVARRLGRVDGAALHPGGDGCRRGRPPRRSASGCSAASLGLAVPGGFERAPTARLGSMFGYGAAYAVASLSCTVGPFLAVTASATRTDTHGDAIVVYGAYAAGFALVVGTLAVAAAFTSAALSARLRHLLPVINRIGGTLVIIVGRVRRLLRDLRTATLPWQRIARGRGDQLRRDACSPLSPAGLTATAAGRGCWPCPCWRR